MSGLAGLDLSKLSPLVDLTILIPNLNMNQFHEELMSRAWIDFGTNISRLEFTSDPSHYESVVRNVFSDIVLSPFNVSGMFSILVTGTHSNCTFAVKVNSNGRHIFLRNLFQYTE